MSICRPAARLAFAAILLAAGRADAASAPSPPSPAPVADQQWRARGADAVLFYRPRLGDRAKAEVPAEGLSNVPLLVQSLETLRPAAAGHPGRTRAGSLPLEAA